jgi:hypothetical protein
VAHVWQPRGAPARHVVRGRAHVTNYLKEEEEMNISLFEPGETGLGSVRTISGLLQAADAIIGGGSRYCGTMDAIGNRLPAALRHGFGSRAIRRGE